MIGHADLCHPIALRDPFSREGWLYELKHDGFRGLAGQAFNFGRAGAGRCSTRFPKLQGRCADFRMPRSTANYSRRGAVEWQARR
jgi:hypothetical protein